MRVIHLSSSTLAHLKPVLRSHSAGPNWRPAWSLHRSRCQFGLQVAALSQPADRSTSPWAHKFFPSVGATTGIALDVLWLTNDDRHLVFITADLGAAFDGILHEVTTP